MPAAQRKRDDAAEFFAQFHAGLDAARSRDLERAAASFGNAAALDPTHAAAHGNHGTVLMELGRWDAALASFDRAIALKPDYAVAHCNRGNVLQELGRWEDALANFDAALARSPNLAAAHSNRGNVLRMLRRWPEALASCGRAIAANPALAEAYSNRGVVFRELGRHAEALEDYDCAVELDPGYAGAYSNRGVLLQELARSDEALADYDRAIALDADFAEAHFNRSTARLARGDFAGGWLDYEWRWKMRGGCGSHERRDYRQPRWLGAEALAGTTVLLHAEQGLGDTLQFCRYAAAVAQRGATVVLEVQAPLKRLLTGLAGAAQVVSRGDPLPKFDFYTSLLSLPFAFKTTLATIPARTPYLTSSPDRRRFWQERLGARTRRRVGLVWSGGFRPDQPELWAINGRRNIPLAKLAPLRHADVEFHSLQKGEAAERELTELDQVGWDGARIGNHAPLLGDFADTAALVDQLDLVIAVDTSTAHLAGAMGKPVWLLNRHDSCWRWLQGRSDSPWYPTLRLYRQTRPGDWDTVIARVLSDLDSFAAESPVVD